MISCRISPFLVMLLLVVAAPPLYADEASDTDLRLELQRVSLYAETGRLEEAYALLDELKSRHPDNPHILLSEAELNLRLGHRAAGVAGLNQAAALDPGNEDILNRQRLTRRQDRPYAALGYSARRSRLANERFTMLSGQAQLSPSNHLRLTMENNHLSSRQPLLRTDGSRRDFHGDRQRASLTLNTLHDQDHESGLSLLAGNDTLGLGGYYSLRDRYGATRLEANLQRPDWDYVESVVGDGTRDNLRLARQQIFTPDLQATLGGGWNRYNLDGDSNIAAAAAWDFNLAYSRPLYREDGSDSGFSFGAYYTVDAEYFDHAVERTDGAGVLYKPLSASSYEVHSAYLSLSHAVTPELHLEGFGGYAVNRLGGKGPAYGAALTYALTPDLLAEARASRGIMGEREGGNSQVDHAGVNLKWQW